MKFNFNKITLKIFIVILLLGFTSAPLSEAICELSHGRNALSQKILLNETKSKNITSFQNQEDDCADPGLSVFSLNTSNELKIFNKPVLFTHHYTPILIESSRTDGIISKFIGNNSPPPLINSNKLYKINSVLLI